MAEDATEKPSAAAPEQVKIVGGALIQLCMDKSVSAQSMAQAIEAHPNEWSVADGKGRYPLQLLCLNATVSPDVLAAFLDRCPEAAKTADGNGLYPIHSLCQNPAVTPELLGAFLARCPVAGAQADGSGYHPLHAMCENVAVVPDLLRPLLVACPEAAKVGNESCCYPLQTLCMNPSVTSELLDLFVASCPEAVELRDDSESYPLHCLCSNPAITKTALQLLLQRFPQAAKLPDYPVLRLCKNPVCDGELLNVIQSYYSEHNLDEDEAFLEELRLQLQEEGDAAMHLMNFVTCDCKLQISRHKTHRTELRCDGYTLAGACVRTGLRSSELRDSSTVDAHFANGLLPRQRSHRDMFFLRWSAKTPARVACFRLRGLCCHKIVNALSHSGKLSHLGADAAEAVIAHAWANFFRCYVGMLLVDFVVLGFVVGTTISMRNGRPAQSWELHIIAAHIVYKLILQVVSLITCVRDSLERGMERPALSVLAGFKTYLTTDLFGTLSLLLEVLALRVMSNVPHLLNIPLLERWFLAFWCGFRWLEIVWGMRVFELFGPRMLPIVNSVRDTAAFGLIFLFCVVASAHAMYVIGTIVDPVGHEIHAAWMVAYRLAVMQDFDIFELENNDPHWTAEPHGLEEADKPASQYYELVHFWFYVNSLLLGLFMNNLITGILGNNYDRFTEASRPLFLREKAGVIARLSTLFVGPLREKIWPKEWESQDLWMAQRAMPDQDHSARAAFRQAIERKARKPLELRMDHLEERVSAKVRALDRHMTSIEGKLDVLLGAQDLGDTKSI